MWEEQSKEWSEMDKRVFDMTPPSQRVTPEEVDWIIAQLKKKTAVIKERLDFEDKIRKRELEKSFASDAVTKPIESIDELDRYVMEGLGYDMEKMEALVSNLTPEQSLALEQIDFTGRIGITMEEMSSELRVVPGLTDEQIQALVEMEMKLLNDEKLKAVNKMEG